MKNVYLRSIFALANIKIPSYHFFRHNFLPQVMMTLTKEIESRLQSAESLCLITDIWTNKQSHEFIAVAVNTINEFFKKKH